YVADQAGNGRIQKRDAQGNWSVIAAYGIAAGQFRNAYALAVDRAGNLYVTDRGNGSGTGPGDEMGQRIQKRDTQGNWSVIAAWDWGLGPVWFPNALAVDAAGNLYVADSFNGYNRIQKRDTRGNWFVIATNGTAPGQVSSLRALAAD